MAGCCEQQACREAGISPATLRRWQALLVEDGVQALMDAPRSGRPPLVVPNAAEAAYLRKAYVKSNLRADAGSMTLASRWAAKNPESPLREETRAAILKPRSSKHALPVEIRRACRASGAVVSRYRDPKAGLNDGIYIPGWLRMKADGSRRVVPGERWVGDDASVNVGVVVPWARGGDACSERWGCRVARYQFLAITDAATDMIVGYHYVMRPSDGYRAEDVVSLVWRTSMLTGYQPLEMVMEGGSWQANRTRQYLDVAGIQIVDAKGRPNQKLIESVFNRLWTVLSLELPPLGQVGRFRGEMVAETADWIACREGRRDPRAHFPTLTEFLAALDRAIAYLNAEQMESREYGIWTPAEAYAAQAIKGQALPQGLRRFALPVREERKLRRSGMAAVRAECPFGWQHTYMFASDAAYKFDGARVTVSFDPHDIGAGAVLELAESFHDNPAGLVIDAAAPCISAAPELLCNDAGEWAVRARDGRGAGRSTQRASRALIGAQTAAFDERGVRAREGSHELRLGERSVAAGVGAAAPAVPVRRAVPLPTQDDWAAMEREAGVLTA